MQTPSKNKILNAKLEQIKLNMFPIAFDSIELPLEIKWHKFAHLCNSSQVLAFDIFGTIKASKFKDKIINEICKIISLNTDKEWQVQLEYEPEENILNETKSSQIDVRISSDNTEIIIECKFTEKEAGRCSQTKKLSKGANVGKTQCNGNYEMQINPVNNIESKCCLTGKGIKYWDYINNIYDIDTAKDYHPCPFNSSNYQLMRNFCIVEDNRLHNKNSKFLIVYVDSDKLQISESINTDTIFGNFKPKQDYYSFLSYQKIINIGLEVSKNDSNDNQIWRDLLIHFNNKIKNYI